MTHFLRIPHKPPDPPRRGGRGGSLQLHGPNLQYKPDCDKRGETDPMHFLQPRGESHHGGTETRRRFRFDRRAAPIQKSTFNSRCLPNYTFLRMRLGASVVVSFLDCGRKTALAHSRLSLMVLSRHERAS